MSAVTEENEMDEMRLLGELRRDPPPMTAAARETARAGILTAARDEAAPAAGVGSPRGARRHPSRRWRRRLALRVAAAGTLAVALAVGGTLVRTFGAGEGGGGGISLLPGAAVASAAELGSLAATAAEQEARPRPDQWIYLKTQVEQRWSGTDPEPVTMEAWYSVDGQRAAVIENGRLRVISAQKFAFIGPRIPVDPGKALSWLRTDAGRLHKAAAVGGGNLDRATLKALEARRALLGGDDGFAFTAIGDSLRLEPLTPQALSTLYRTLPLITGVTVQRDARDALGRPGVAFALVTGSIRREIILDARTYRYLGSRSVAARDIPAVTGEARPGWRGKGEVVTPAAKAGDVLDAASTLARVVVDEPGARG